MSEKVHNLAIYGMTCGCCTGRVMRVLQSNPDVLDAKLSFENDSGIIKTTDKLTTDKVIVMVNEAGFIASA
ncbi:MAG: heavy-metal-associated domain-containing protein [Euryarchaeota archaeon]|nr:heavy-metal-associated domain-containing protein [Euryarchaeota archaeon]MBT7988207.1 heavy-metal-associated domain-containing protein [Euryarchaeota archaeon]